MNAIANFQDILQQGQTTTEVALELFDRLAPVDLDFMIGRWRGAGFPTNHKMDGLLETFGWYGKEFVSADCVHPLLFADGSSIYKVDPNPALMNLGFKYPLPQDRALQPVYRASTKLLKTEASKARMRMMEHRGKVSATMIYDYMPIIDVFRLVDENTLLGLMDLKDMPQPFFFVLNRDLV